MSDPEVKRIPARALIDLPKHKAKAGQWCEVPADVAKQMAKDGEIDLAPAAVAYAAKHAKPEPEGEDAAIDA